MQRTPNKARGVKQDEATRDQLKRREEARKRRELQQEADAIGMSLSEYMEVVL